MHEFDMIRKYFLPLAMEKTEAGGLSDDAALLKIPAGHELVVSSDTLNAGTHFLENESPDFIAHKALRANLSDLAAMGAEPYAYQLCVAFPQAPSEIWLRDFTAALLDDQKKFNIFCSGGDTTSIKGALSVTITAFGLVPEDKAVKRSGAKDGDLICLTGPVGNAWIGLEILRNIIAVDDPDIFIQAYRKPEPRLSINRALREYAHAAIDISDGLVADLGHICSASQLGADLELQNIQFSAGAKKMLEADIVTPEQLLTGGDDYELLLALPQAKKDGLSAALTAQGLRPQFIGRFTKDHRQVRLMDEKGLQIPLKNAGWRHF